MLGVFLAVLKWGAGLVYGIEKACNDHNLGRSYSGPRVCTRLMSKKRGRAVRRTYLHQCMYVCMYVCVYVCIYTYIDVCLSVCVCMYAYLRRWKQTCACPQVEMRASTCMYMYTYIYTHAFVHMCIYIYVYVYIFACECAYVLTYIEVYIYIYMLRTYIHNVCGILFEYTFVQVLVPWALGPLESWGDNGPLCS